MTTIDGKSPNLAHETKVTIRDLLMEPAIRDRLAQICPDAFCDGDLQMDLLLEAMGKYHTTEDIKELVVDENERYEFRWSGKQKAKYESQKSSTGTLRPCPEESKNWDTTQNLYIEGDNLEVLKILKRAYAGKIKMIYIDPPYNTGKDFVYKDDYTDNLKNYLEQTGQLTADGKVKSSNTASDGRFHTNWLNMMYPRLRLARELLSDDGVIFISISDSEFDNLKKVCDEIFLSQNYLGDIIWNSTKSVTNTALISVSHTYNLVYFKHIDYYIENRTEFRLKDTGEGFENPDNDPQGPWKADPFQVGGWRPNQQYEIKNPITGVSYFPNLGSSWKNDYTKFQQLMKEGRIVFGKNGEGAPMRKRYIWEAEERGKVAKTLWDDVETTTNGTQLLKSLFDGNIIFDNPKPVGLLHKIIELGSKQDSIILDFFSGSATTAHAVMQLNAEDNGKRQYIMVQLPENIQPVKDKKGNIISGDTNNNAIAFLDSIHRPHNICEIGKERIRRAGEKVKLDAGLLGKDLDVGFKVFKLSESNMNKWHLELADLKDKNDMEKAAIAALRAGKNTIRRKEIVEENARRKAAGLAPFDIDLCVIYEWLLKYGVMPDCRITTAQVGGHKVYSVSGGAFMVCLEQGLNLDWAKALVAYRDKCFHSLDDATKADAWHVMVADACFDSTKDMQNVAKTLHDSGLKEEHWIVV